MRNWSSRAMLVLSDYVHNLIMRIRAFFLSTFVCKSWSEPRFVLSPMLLSLSQLGSRWIGGQVGRRFAAGEDECICMWIRLTKCEYPGSEWEQRIGLWISWTRSFWLHWTLQYVKCEPPNHDFTHKRHALALCHLNATNNLLSIKLFACMKWRKKNHKTLNQIS